MEKRVISTQMQDEDIILRRTLRPMNEEEDMVEKKANAELKGNIDEAK